MEVEMKIRGLMMDPVTNMPIVVLKDVQGQAILPIWVGVYEANAIALEIEKVQTPRPMTHDLLQKVIESTGGQLEKVVINDLRAETWFAQLVIKNGGKTVEVDARPSDAMAIAVRTNAPVFINPDALNRWTESSKEQIKRLEAAEEAKKKNAPQKSDF